MVSGGWWFLGYYLLPAIDFKAISEDSEKNPDLGFKHLLCAGYDPLIILDGEISHKNPNYIARSKSSKKVNPASYEKAKTDEEDGKNGEIELPECYPNQKQLE